MALEQVTSNPNVYVAARAAFLLLFQHVSYLRVTGDPWVLGFLEKALENMRKTWISKNKRHIYDKGKCREPGGGCNWEMDNAMAFATVAMVGNALEQNDRDARTAKRFVHDFWALRKKAEDFIPNRLTHVFSRYALGLWHAYELTGDPKFKKLMKREILPPLVAAMYACNAREQIWPQVIFDGHPSHFAQPTTYVRYTVQNVMDLTWEGVSGIPDLSRMAHGLGNRIFVGTYPHQDTLAPDVAGGVADCGLPPASAHHASREWTYEERMSEWVALSAYDAKIDQEAQAVWDDHATFARHGLPGWSVGLLVRQMLRSYFVDVFWAESYIYDAYRRGLVDSCATSPLKYCPNGFVSRAQMAVTLGKAAHGSNYMPPVAQGIFEDVPAERWDAAWIEQLKEDGITTGCKSALFCPESLVNRAQMAVFLLRSLEGADYRPPKAEGVFVDVPASHWAAKWIEQLVARGITSGCGSNPARYCPDRFLTRAQMAVWVAGAFPTN